MAQMIRTVMLSIMLAVSGQIGAAVGAEREQVRIVINLVAGVKMPFPENLRNNLAHTERVQLDTNGATVACLRLDDKIRWCYEHIAPVGARAEMLRIRTNLFQGCWSDKSFSTLTILISMAPLTSVAQPSSKESHTRQSAR